MLKYIAERNLYNEHYNASIFIASNKLCIPDELKNLITVSDIPGDIIGEISLSLKGLNELQITQILSLSYQRSGRIGHEEKQLILEQKQQLIKKSELLEIVPVNESLDDIGGLRN